MSNISKLNTDFNTSPYFDDYDENKNFYRMMFKPRVAVQTREINQTQSIFQNQIKRFADHIFVEGTLVSGGEFTFLRNLYYLKIADTSPNGNPVNVNDFIGANLTGGNKQVTALVHSVEDGVENTSDPKTIFVYMIATGSDNTTNMFEPGEEILADNGLSFTILSGSESVGQSTAFNIKSGIVFAKGHFINFDEQSLIISKYSINPSTIVGLDIVEEIIDYVDDYTLLDPAQGFTNYAAPGADRLKLTAVLVKYPYNSSDLDSFVELFKMNEGTIEEKFDRTQYSKIRDELARRTYDESGDYYVSGLDIIIREHLNNGTNNGYLTSENGGDSTKLNVGVTAGRAYVKGYDIEKLVTTNLVTDKGTSVAYANNQPVSINYGNYVIVNELVGDWNVNSGSVLSLYDTAQTRITSKTWSASSQTGNVIGTAKLKAVEWISGTKGTPSAQYKIYLYDVKLTGSKFKNIRSIFLNNSSTADIGADIVLNSGSAVLYENSFRSGVYQISSKSLKTLKNEAGDIDTAATVLKTFDLNIPTTGNFTLNTGSSNITFENSIGSLNSSQKSKIHLTFNTQTYVTLDGTASAVSGSPNIIGSGTTFTKLNVGDKITLTGLSGIYFIQSISNNTALTLTSNALGTVSGAAIQKNYYVGDVIDLNTLGYSTGTSRSATVSTANLMTFALNETIANNVSASITVNLIRNLAREGLKVKKSNRFVQISCATSGIEGPFNLGFSDVIKIRSIRKKNGSVFANNSEGIDVTQQFKLDNGQRDDVYDHAKIICRGITLTNTDYLLVELDYFQPSYTQGSGYFSVDSYPIDDTQSNSSTTIRTEEIPIFKSPSNGISYDLRNCIDTRPIKTISANDSTTVAGASISPSVSETFVYATDGLMTPVPNSNYDVTYQYYVGRKDVVVMDQMGTLKIVKGVPDVTPITPNIPADSMQLATITIAPYPSLTTTYAAEIGRLNIANNVSKTSYKRYTMRDVGVLDNRITNLEYYTALTLLEKRTLDLKITDDNGLERYKNGIFVDGFNNHLNGDLDNPDFKICVDSSKGEIRPLFSKDMVPMSYLSGSNISVKNGLVTLDYTEEKYLSQPFATSIRNAASSFWSFKGKIQLNPASDYWNDIQTLPAIQVTDDATAIAMQSVATALGISWNDWQTTSTGVLTSNTTTNSAATMWASAGTTTTNTLTTTNVSTRTGTNYVTNNSSVTQSLGNRVVSAALIPYMRSIPIKVFANGLKPNTKIYAFFDGESVTEYVMPTDSSYVVSNPANIGTLVTDSLGSFYGIFLLPSNENKRFTTGTKIFKLTDVMDNGNSAITSAEVSYTSQGLNEQIQETYLTTGFATLEKQNLSETNTSTSVQSWSWTNPATSFTWFQSGCCFLGHCKVLMEDGSYKRIDEVVVGDRVQGTNTVNTVTKIQTPYIAERSIKKFGNVEVTDDHLFLTDKGWKTWRPDRLINKNRPNSRLLEGENRDKSINNSDALTFFNGADFIDSPVKDLNIITSYDYKPHDIVYDLFLDGNHTYIVEGYVVHNCDPIAQTYSTDTRNNYLFVTSLNLYFQTKDTNLGVTVELREVSSDGYLTRKTIPYAKVFVPASQINVSDTGTVATKINFPGPICLTGDTQYGIAVIPQNNSPNFRLWSSRLGEIDKITGTRVSSQPLAGNLFVSSDSATWTAIQDEDLKFDLYRAKFNIESAGNVDLRNSKIDVFEASNVIGNWLSYSEPVVGEYRITISGTPVLSSGYTLTLNGKTATITSISGSVVRAYTSDGSDLSIGAITIRDTSNTIVFTGNAITLSRPYGTLERKDVSDDVVVSLKLSNVNGTFEVGERLTGQYSNNTANISQFVDIPYSVIDMESSYLELTYTSVDWTMRTSDGTNVDTFNTFAINDNTYLDTEKKVLSSSIENATLGSYSLGTHAVLQSISDYVSPIIDLNRTYAILVHNIINNDVTGEDEISGGNCINKYISQKIELKNGQDAEDLKVILSAYRPFESDVKVYAKLINGEDSETFEEKKWFELEMATNSNLYSNSINKEDFKEFEWNIPASMMTGPFGEFSYVNNQGVTLSSFKQFQIKILLSGTNSANVPRAADLSVIAMQL